MNMSLFEYMLTELDRRVSAASVTEYKIATQRMRRLAATADLKSVSRAQVVQDDDLLFDNVPL